MTLLDRLHAALQGTLTGAGKMFHETLEPWMKGLLTTVSHDAVTIAAAAATGYVEQAAPALAAAAASGDWQGFADKQAAIIAQTATDLEKNATKTAVTDVSTAVIALVAGHPAMQAAQAAPALAAPAPATAPAA